MLLASSRIPSGFNGVRTVRKFSCKTRKLRHVADPAAKRRRLRDLARERGEGDAGTVSAGDVEREGGEQRDGKFLDEPERFGKAPG